MKTIIERAAEDGEAHKAAVAELHARLVEATAEHDVAAADAEAADAGKAEAAEARAAALELELAAANEQLEKLKDDLEEQFENTMEAKMEGDAAARRATALEQNLQEIKRSPGGIGCPGHPMEAFLPRNLRRLTRCTAARVSATVAATVAATAPYLYLLRLFLLHAHCHVCYIRAR